MIPYLVRPKVFLRGRINLCGDKSITHRAVIISSLAEGKTRIYNPAINKDCQFTIQALRKLGIRIIRPKNKNYLIVFGKGINGLRRAKGAIFCGESGTTLRLMAGLLAGQDFNSVLSAGKSLSRRPMKRIIIPLRLMGSAVTAKAVGAEFYPPLKIKKSKLKGITYKIPVASAQVKSAILLAGLFAQGRTRITEPVKTRDHTERMLELFGTKLSIKGKNISLGAKRRLVAAGKIFIPADISSAAYFIIAALLLDGSRISVKSVSLNPSRIGLIRVLKRMGADIKIRKNKIKNKAHEPTGDITARFSRLKAVIVKKEEIPSLIDELPVLIVAACFASGRSKFAGVEELRVKETDRIHSMVASLRKMGAKIFSVSSGSHDSLQIEGGQMLRGAKVNSFGDHRTAMSLVIAALNAEGQTTIDDISCIEKSFPDFIQKLNQVIKDKN